MLSGKGHKATIYKQDSRKIVWKHKFVSLPAVEWQLSGLGSDIIMKARKLGPVDHKFQGV